MKWDNETPSGGWAKEVDRFWRQRLEDLGCKPRTTVVTIRYEYGVPVEMHVETEDESPKRG